MAVLVNRGEWSARVDLHSAAAAAAAYVASVQEASGAIPWFPGGHLDPWDHVEAAIGLDLAAMHERAGAAYRWLATVQNPDGSWPARIEGGRITDPTRDTNFSTYVAVGVWAHYLITRDAAFLRDCFPMVQRGIDFALRLQGPHGEVFWATDGDGNVWDEALVTGSSSVYLSLRCAIDAAAELGVDAGRWRRSQAALGVALTSRPYAFAQLGRETRRYSMDWYYPVLAGALPLAESRLRLESQWDEYVRPGWGALCVCDEPWVTVAETCELAIALVRARDHVGARDLLQWVSRYQDDDGAFWTGVRHPDGALWPPEKPTWTAGAFIMAASLLDGNEAMSRIFDA